jgi:hypothetical protein
MRALEKSERERERTEVALAMYDSKKEKLTRRKKLVSGKEKREEKTKYK